MGGATGNKGGCGIRLRFYNTSLCFLSAHFAPHQNNVADRNSDYNDIARKMFTSIGKPLGTHDYVFWCGDFNYRVDLSNEQCRQLIIEQDWTKLLEQDQLRTQIKEEKVFHKYHEGEINFAPTYKYDIGSDVYDTSEKARIPAWTDRVLFRKYYATRPEERSRGQLDYGQILFYERAELKISDHRPVLAQFAIDVLQVDTDKRIEVFKDTLRKLGPLDATVVVREETGVGRAMEVFEVNGTGGKIQQQPIEPNYVQEIVNKLHQEVGTIILARFGADHLRLTFKEGTLALKAAALEHITVLDKVFRVSHKETDWVQLIETEINQWTRAVPLVESNGLIDIDKLEVYDVKIKTRASSPEALLEPEIIAPSGPPIRPPPPAETSKPLRPAPPPPAFVGECKSTLDDDLLDISNSTLENTNNSSFAMSPPKVPPPVPPSLINHDYNSQDFGDYDDDEDDDREEEEEEDEGETSFDQQPPSGPPPCQPPNIPPPTFQAPQRPAPSRPPPQRPAPSVPSQRPPPVPASLNLAGAPSIPVRRPPPPPRT